MQIVKEKISIDELKKMSEKMFGRLVKAVVDIEQEIMVVDVSLHGEGESLLLDNGSAQDNVWAISIFPSELPNENWIEFDSIMNIRPFIGNKTRGIENEQLRKKIVIIVNKLVAR
jgi:uncharacterized protein DUF5674